MGGYLKKEKKKQPHDSAEGTGVKSELKLHLEPISAHGDAAGWLARQSGGSGPGLAGGATLPFSRL